VGNDGKVITPSRLSALPSTGKTKNYSAQSSYFAKKKFEHAKTSEESEILGKIDV
jgi:hypothetical protein